MLTFTPTPRHPDTDRAKQIIIEIIRCNNGQIIGKLKLFKIFYFAHLMYAKSSPGYLSSWPIVRMPNGPGIDEADSLIFELSSEGALDVRQVPCGPFVAFEYRTKTAGPANLEPDAIEAIRHAVEFAVNSTAEQLSNYTHEYSHSWNNSKNGDELNIYMDMLTDEEYKERSSRVQESVSDLADVFK